MTGTAGSASTAVIPFSSAPDGSALWLSFSQSFSAANFGVTQATWLAILADVTGITLGSHIYAGFDDVGFDNFQLAPSVPQPTSLVLLTIGSLASRRRRTRG